MATRFDKLHELAELAAKSLGLTLVRSGRPDDDGFDTWQVRPLPGVARRYPDDAAHTLALEFDGSCNPNPGGRCGYGWRLVRADGRLLREDGGEADCQPKTNNAAEWHALCAGLTWLAASVAGGLAVGRLVILGDSRLVVSQLNLTMRAKKPWLRSYRDRARATLKRIGCEWEAEWVPRAMNARADELSKPRDAAELRQARPARGEMAGAAAG